MIEDTKMQGVSAGTADTLKGIFDGLLKEELKGSALRVDARYVLSRNPFLMQFVVRGKVLKVRINLGLFRELQRGRVLPQAWSVYYCAFFISNYVKALGAALPEDNTDKGMRMNGVDTYFEGLVRLEATQRLSSRRAQRVYPVFHGEFVAFRKGKNRRKRPLGCLEILCDTNALIRARTVCAEQLDDSLRTWMDRVIEERLLFMELPEIFYGRRGMPKATFGQMVMLAMREKKAGESGDFLDVRKESAGKEFWLGALLRLCICEAGVYAGIEDEELRDAINERAVLYQGKAAELYDRLQETDSELLRDDFSVVIKLSQGMHVHLGEGNVHPGGGVHIAY